MNSFDSVRFKSGLNTHTFGKNTFVFDELDSTNAWLKSANSDDIQNGSICLADVQYAGRGQHKRAWISDPASNLTWSIVYKTEQHDRLFMLTLASMLAVSEIVDEELGLTSRLKWPNDLMIDRKKIGGVLAEAVFNGNHLDRFIVGIGLNINQSTFPSDLPNAVSMSMLTGRYHNREDILARIVNKIELMFDKWMQHDRQLVKSINERLLGYGEKVYVDVDGMPLEGKKLMLGVNVSGHLHLMDDDYTVHTYAYEQVRINTNL